MWLEAILSREDLEHALRSLTPTTLELGSHGSVQLGVPTDVRLVPGFGLRVSCPATLHGSLLHLAVPVTVRSASLSLLPSIVVRSGREVLVFSVTVESIDVAAMPHIVEEVAVDAVNAALVDAELVWDFRETLSHRVTLPEALMPARSIDLSAAWGEIRITEEALVLAVSVHAVFDARHALALAPLARKATRRVAPSLRQIAAASGLVGLILTLTGLVVGRRLGRRHGRNTFPLLGYWPG